MRTRRTQEAQQTPLFPLESSTCTPPPTIVLQLPPSAVSPLSQSELNIETKTRSNALPWRGQFSPQLCESFLRSYGHQGALVLDPFAGSGTVLVEAARLGMSAIGAEINPAAVIMARIYEFIKKPLSQRHELLARFERDLNCACGESPLFELPTSSAAALESRILASAKAVECTDERILWEALIILLDLHAIDLTCERMTSMWGRLRELVSGLPHHVPGPQVFAADARALPIPASSVDLVLTSPPYINVFNYHQQFRKAIEALGWNVLDIAQSEIGANRKFRVNRFLTVVQYCIDMSAVLCELNRVCKPSGRLILVIGRESNVRKTSFENGRLVSSLIERVLGQEILLRQERVFTNRFGQPIFEDILHVQPGTLREPPPRNACIEIALEELRGARLRANPEAVDDLEDAIQKASSVSPSPLARINPPQSPESAV